MRRYSDVPLMEHMRSLFPICRSIMGPGQRQTLDYFDSYFPELQRIIFKSGTHAYDWEIPQEWQIEDAFIEDVKTGKKYCEFQKNNLHIVNYSTCIDKVMTLEELQKHLYSIPEKPNWIPYVTSYFKREWGFCISDNEKKSLTPGNYRIYINSSHQDGELHISDGLLKGESPKEIVFSSYTCHPSMANNELSGPVLVCAIMDYIKLKYPKRKWSYRFILQPETIGSIAYLSKYRDQMQMNTLFGINISCAGDNGPYSYVETPRADTLADNVIKSIVSRKNDHRIYSFLERGSDERQYCAPGINLPFITFSRSKFGEYDEYHSSADDLEFVSEEGLLNSLACLQAIVDAMETCFLPQATILCEPQLGKRGLYPTTSVATDGRHPAQTRSDLLAYSDGKTNIFEISLKTNVELEHLTGEAKVLTDNGLLKDAG